MNTILSNVKPIVVGEDGSIAPEEFTEVELEFFQGWQPVTKVTGKDFEELARVGQKIRAIPKLCWQNARRVVQKLDEYADASYVEGIVCLNGGPAIEHAWVCLPDGTVIDPTLPRHTGVHFPGLEFRGRAGIEEFLSTPQGSACMKSPFFYAFGWGGRNSPGIQEAWRLSQVYMRERYPEAFTNEQGCTP
ncbi:MAG: hypothetical protein ABS79_00760 [Planctomycetes bacterium SCN 63-9]|nr:MAG: hypothetical protein ABS79_00760 [Planctomycetes bacterium SCN 63-9]